MNDDSYPPRVEPRRPEPVAQRPPPWPMIIGIGLLGILAVVMVVLVFSGNGGDPDGSPSPSAVASGSAQASATASSEPSLSASTPAESGTPGPTPTPVSLDLDTIVVSTVSDLSVRAEAGTGAERLGSLENGTPSFVAGGPVDADGYRWYLLSGLGLPPNSGCAGPFETDPFNCPVWFGWVASGSLEGVPWLAPQAPECAATPVQFEEIVLGVTDLMRLACFGSDPFTFRAWWPEIPEDAGLGGACASQDEPSGWLLCQNINYDGVKIDDTQDFGGIGLNVTIDPASGVSMPARGTWIELTVHLDDPAAQGCDEAALAHDGEDPAGQYVLFCRGQMVVESVAAVDGP